MSYAKTLARLRKESGYTQNEVAEHLNRFSQKTYSFKHISSWENGVAEPPNQQFLLLCELYEVKDIQGTFRGIDMDYRNLSKLNALGRSRVEEYISMLSGNPMFSEGEDLKPPQKPRRSIRLYDIPVAAGTGSFLDGDAYEEFEADDTVPDEADFAVKVSGDSMTPRFVDGQIIFIKQQQALEVGEIGIFELNGDSYVKKLGKGELLSLNSRYKPIHLGEFDTLRIFGKVVG